MNYIIYSDTYYTGAVDENNHLIRTTDECHSKVYRTYSARTPSGFKKYAKVWNDRLHRVIDIRLDTQLVAVID